MFAFRSASYLYFYNDIASPVQNVKTFNIKMMSDGRRDAIGQCGQSSFSNISLFLVVFAHMQHVLPVS